jgi:heme-degrading monooxygenase HmoA
MIARTWNGTARIDKADAYVAHLREKTFPQLAAIAGHRGAYVLRRSASDAATVAFTVVTLWESLDSVRRFAGDDPEVAVVPAEAQALLVTYDDRAVHWDVAHHM